MYFSSIAEAVGRTPLVALKNIAREYAPEAELLAKVESMNPTGSVKDRAAGRNAAGRGGEGADRRRYPPPRADQRQHRQSDLAAIAASKGLALTIVMPDTMSEERRRMMTAFGAKLILTEGRLGMQGAVDRAERLHREVKNSSSWGSLSIPPIPPRTTRRRARRSGRTRTGRGRFRRGVGTAAR